MILQVVGSPDFWKLQQNGRKLHKGLKSDVKTAPQTNPVCPYGGMVTHKTWVMKVKWPRNLAAFFGRATPAAMYLHLHLATSRTDGMFLRIFHSVRQRSRVHSSTFSSWREPVRGINEDDFLHEKNIFRETDIWHLKIDGWKLEDFIFSLLGAQKALFFMGLLPLLGCPAGT